MERQDAAVGFAPDQNEQQQQQEKKHVKKRIKREAPTGEGRSVSHANVACLVCRSKRTRCSGQFPCERCVKMGMQCQYSKVVMNLLMKERKREEEERGRLQKTESEFLRGNNDFDNNDNYDQDNNYDLDADYDDERSSSKSTKDAAEDASSSDSVEILPTRRKVVNATTTTTTSITSITRTELTTTKVLPPPQLAEIVLADSATASFLMSIFTSRILPHYMATHSLPDPSFFLSSFEQPASVAAAMQRDGALALACRNAGHEALAKLLIGRMDRMADVVKEHFSSTNEGYSSYVFYYLLTVGENAEKGPRVSLAMMDMLPDYIRYQQEEDLEQAVCGPLATMRLSDEDEGGDGISRIEIEAHVRFSVQQTKLWLETLPDPRLKLFIAMTTIKRSKISVPRLRPIISMLMTLVIDLQLLGLIVPPYLAKIMTRIDPQGLFGLRTFFNPSGQVDSLPEPMILPQEVAAGFLRRVQVTRKLFSAIADMPMLTMLITLECYHTIILFRSGRIQEAQRAAKATMALIGNHDPNFWPPLVLQTVFILAPVFYEVGDVEGLDEISRLTSVARRTVPSAKFGIAVLNELRANLVNGNRL